MKVIDLLKNKIANGEYPDFKYYGGIYKYNKKSEKYLYGDMWFDFNSFENLNDEIEILEEKKIFVPEKINKSYDIRIFDLDKPHSIKDYDMEQLIEMVQDIYEKQGEICDYLKSKGDE